jgi:hypothetical protein
LDVLGTEFKLMLPYDTWGTPREYLQDSRRTAPGIVEEYRSVSAQPSVREGNLCPAPPYTTSAAFTERATRCWRALNWRGKEGLAEVTGLRVAVSQCRPAGGTCRTYTEVPAPATLDQPTEG